MANNWELTLTVETPTGQELYSRVTFPPNYMDWSMMEHALGRMQAAILGELQAREELA